MTENNFKIHATKLENVENLGAVWLRIRTEPDSTKFIEEVQKGTKAIFDTACGIHCLHPPQIASANYEEKDRYNGNYTIVFGEAYKTLDQ